MPSDKEKRESVEFLRTHRCADEGSAHKTVGSCLGCIRALFGNDDALCNLDSSGPGMWPMLAEEVMRMATEAQIRAQKKYDAENTRQVHLKLNRRTDGDVLEKLDSVPSKQGYIKELIRADLKK